ncbi:MAG: Phospholipase D/Transphosphatidylase [Candidatus Moranbacteria bacterium GW2011_GWF2_34_56]|nr:MAG: Phospholipase D/Transphosphatidylase [Candidatus Moranbacteria bacterium GW2011_GWF1_34_10]KKP65185.1 MAG: Phospholipase D/Transphosphatidylase [Candidatus Moranbacteria bacterium GW2011_GWF2_34_56]HBI16729.1 hypothetical protein [Candidatus Moranbacteria bacterium]
MKFKSFSLNSDFYASLLKDLTLAKKKIYLETYIYREDELGGKIKEILIEKANQGVEVKLLMDAIGSVAISEFNFINLILAGGTVNFFRRLLLIPFHLAKLNNRNHRKLALIDDEIAYIGSSNLDQETSDWREFNLRIEDKKLNEVLSKIFIEQFLISNTLTMDNAKCTRIQNRDGIKILRSAPFVKNPIREHFLKLISKAEKEIIIENPYVVFDKKIYRYFKNALNRGVKIKIILPTISDVGVMQYLNKKFVRRIRKIGIQIYFYPSMLHSKLFLIDKKEWMLGSANLDYRSMFTQFEIMLAGNDLEIKKLIQMHLDESLSRAKSFDEINHKKLTLKEKVIGNLLYLVKFLF